MDATRSHRGIHLGRLPLLAVLAGAAWCVLSIFATSSAASAAEDKTPGLLGAVTETVSDVGEVISGVTNSVDPVVSSVATAVAPAVEPIPAPVAEPVAQVVDTAAAAAEHTVAVVDQTVVAAVDTTMTAAADIADAGVVGQVVEPLVEAAGSVPVVGDVLDETGLGGTLTDTATVLDSTVGAVVGGAGEGVGSVLPDLPLSGIDVIVDALRPQDSRPPLLPLPSVPSSGVLVSTSASTPGTTAVSDDPPGDSAASRTSGWERLGASQGTGASSSGSAPVMNASETPAPGSPGGALGGGSTSGAASSGAAGTGAALASEHRHGSTSAFIDSHSPADDALPGSPVFDSDVSPD